MVRYTYILTGDTIESIKTMDSKTIIYSMYPIRLRNCRYCWHLVFNNACNKTVTATTDPASRIIILDAGHGGEDGGTSSTDGTKEKTLI